jgi:hypothetical protein
MWGCGAGGVRRGGEIRREIERHEEYKIAYDYISFVKIKGNKQVD